MHFECFRIVVEALQKIYGEISLWEYEFYEDALYKSIFATKRRVLQRGKQ